MQKFQDWLNDNYSYNRPFPSQYRELHGIGADLDFVNRLAVLVWAYDWLRARAAKSGRRKPKADSSVRRDRLMLRVAAFAALEGMRYGTVDDQKAIDIAEASLERAKALNFPRTVTINAQGKQPIKELVEALAAPEFKMDKCLLIMLEYILTAQRAHVGRTPDEWGTLILVALTEHLKKKTGRPHPSLAIRTLKALRGQRVGSKSTEGENAKSRVSGFKKRHKDWTNLLKDLER